MTSLGGTPTLIGLPYDASSSYQRGPADAPAAIRDALWSPSANSWTELGVNIGAEGAITDAGDLELGACSPANARRAIENGIARLLAMGARPVSLGGDHSVTYPVLRAVRPHAPRLTIVHIDAHPDLYDEFEGDRYSHACPFARIMEEKLADRLVQVGIRTMTGHQRAQARRFGVEVMEMRQHPRRPSYLVRVRRSMSRSTSMRSIPRSRPGFRIASRAACRCVNCCRCFRRIDVPIVAADVVELNPRNDPSGVSAMVAAKVLRELLGVMLRSRELIADGR